jgi:hypothetical protein
MLKLLIAKSISSHLANGTASLGCSHVPGDFVPRFIFTNRDFPAL